MNDVIINKVQSIQRCVQRAREEYHAAPDSFATDYTRQDAAVLNILRACEQTIDLANHVIKTEKLGVPTSTAETFELLQRASIIDAVLGDKLKKMVHFRNLLIHQYERTNLEIVQSVITSALDDLVQFGDRILSRNATG
jgi:uncharacterized protein YutE (UPF0331/DUF86 family)